MVRLRDDAHPVAGMLILAEGMIHHPPVTEEYLAAIRAWLGPMVDEGFLLNGYLDEAGHRLWMVLSSPSIEAAEQRLGDLPPARDGSVSFTTVVVTALRFR
jgi:hypothetical protein